jgi:hypothetical protein
LGSGVTARADVVIRIVSKPLWHTKAYPPKALSPRAKRGHRLNIGDERPSAGAQLDVDTVSSSSTLDIRSWY